tara:strand:- start:41 stop:436 length:396 start_codon:yes stop_codon:yes gene_type:complete
MAFELWEQDLSTNDHPVDSIEPQGRAEDEVRDSLRVALREVITWIERSPEASSIISRVKVLSNALGIQERSFAKIARDVGLSREGVRLMSKDLELKFNLRPSNSRSDSTRNKCKMSRLKFEAEKFSASPPL